MGRRRAFTLAEILVVIFLLMVVTSLMAEVLGPSLALFRLQSARSDSEQGPLIFIHQVNRALLNAQVESIVIGTRPTSIAWVDVNEDDPFDSSSGAPKLSQKFSILYHDPAGERVWVKTWPPAPPSFSRYDFAPAREPLVLAQDDLRAICEQRNGTERVLVKNVRSLTITDDGGGSAPGLLMLPLHLAITCVTHSGARVERAGEGQSFSMQTKLLPRCVRW